MFRILEEPTISNFDAIVEMYTLNTQSLLRQFILKSKEKSIAFLCDRFSGHSKVWLIWMLLPLTTAELPRTPHSRQLTYRPNILVPKIATRHFVDLVMDIVMQLHIFHYIQLFFIRSIV